MNVLTIIFSDLKKDILLKQTLFFFISTSFWMISIAISKKYYNSGSKFFLIKKDTCSLIVWKCTYTFSNYNPPVHNKNLPVTKTLIPTAFATNTVPATVVPPFKPWKTAFN